ncbi:MAG TPA: tetratricopeptide repeat protein [Thermoanaerobaculia bacterium]
MPPIPFPFRRACLALLLLCVALPSLAVKPPKENERWIVVNADGVTIYSNAADDDARAAAEAVLRLREAAGAQARLPVKVYAFRDAAAFAPYGKALQPAKKAAGFTLATPEVILVVLQADRGFDGALAKEVAQQFGGTSAVDSNSALNVTAVAQPTVMPRDEVLYQLGYLLVRGGNRRDAETFLTQTVRLNPQHAAAYDDLGLLYAVGKRHAEAGVAFDRAIALGATSPNLYVRYGMTILDQLEARPARQEVAPAAIAKMRDLFGKAAQLEPSNALAWMGLGATHIYTPDDTAPGITALKKSVQLAPDNRQAMTLLMKLTFIHAGKLLLEDKPTRAQLHEAVTLLRHVHAESKDPEEKARAGTLAEMADVLYLQSQAAELTAILNLANAGNVKEALVKVDALIPQLQNEKLLKAARKLRGDLARDVR